MYSTHLVDAGVQVRLRSALFSCLLISGSLIAGGLRASEEAEAKWIADFQRYAVQEGNENDGRDDTPQPGILRWEDVIKGLPAPAQWESLHRQLLAAAAALPEGKERARLQAAGWLAAYLRGKKDEILASLPAAPSDPDQAGPADFSREMLRASLEETERGAMSAEQAVKQFEEQLLMFEPVDIEAVKQALGGEENLARLRRLIDAGQAMQRRAMEVYEALEKDKDEAAARRKMEELGKEFEAAHGADQKALEPFQDDPLLRRYVASLYQQEMPSDRVPGLPLPDLVTAIGAGRAEALLRRALRLPVKLGANRESGESTVKLARELALAEAAHLKVASWGLAQDVAAAPLFEALQERFGEPKADDYEYRRARGYYLVALIQQGRVPAAVELATASSPTNQPDLPYDVLNALEKSGHAEALWQFLQGWLTRHPAADEWSRFTRLSAELDRQAELKKLIRTLAEQGAFAGMDRLRVQRLQAEAELAVDDLAAAEKRLRALVAPPGAPEELPAQLDLAEKLMQLADLRGDTAAFASAQANAEALIAAARKSQREDPIARASSLATTLNQLGRLAEAERISREALAEVEQTKQAASSQPDSDPVSTYAASDVVKEQLCALVGLKRWEDAERLINESPWWAASDVADLLDERVASTNRPLGWYFAEVLRNRGQENLARRILEVQLVSTPGVDAVYESYLGLAGPEALRLLGQLAATDRYEERPLIWQAQIHLDAKAWDKAVTALEAAIAIDPSDGEQGRGDRMRVYALLARAMAAKGDTAKATFLEGVVKAIRLSETADRWFDAGAFARAIRLYRESLGFFQDAYCIQSRLAVRLAGEGKMDEAAEHYRRAFELMPDSFGRVESHCFGCEHVFSGAKSQGVAEEVFARMLAARPDKPQLHYLLGYLRQEQERPAEAAKLYRKAIELDPLYLNAWNKLAGLGQNLKFTPQERDDLMLKLTELDPGRRHVSPSLNEVSDLPRLWRTLAASQRELEALPSADKLYALKGSAAVLAADGNHAFRRSRSKLGTDFASVMGEHRFVQALQEYVAALGQPE